MRLEWPDFTSTTLGRRVVDIATGLRRSVEAARAAYIRPTPTPQSVVGNVLKTGYAARSAPLSPSEQNMGYWKPFSSTHVENQSLTAAMHSTEARRNRVTAGAGQEPLSMQPWPELTLSSIASAQRRCDMSGWADRKVEIDARYLRGDSHLQACDRIRRSVYTAAPFRIKPRSSRPLSILVANAVRACIEELDGFSSTAMELAGIGCYGYAVGELIWGDRKIAIPTGRNSSVVVESEIITSIEHVYQRNTAFDIVDDSSWLCMGPGQFVPLSDRTAQKFVTVKGCGDAPTRWRGYGWANQWISYLSGLSLEKWGTVIETFGVSTPYLQNPDGKFLGDAEHDHALDVLSDIGTGRPAVFPAQFGEIKFTPVPAGLAPMHAQILGYLKAEQAKLCLSATLQMEIGGVGSYAAATTHKDQQTATQKLDASLIAEALRTQPIRWLVEVNARAWAAAFAPLCGGCTPEQIIAEAPGCEWVISDETSAQRLSIFQGVKGLGFAVDEAQVREELGVRAPLGDATIESPTMTPSKEP